jgi:hypothetical protein
MELKTWLTFAFGFSIAFFMLAALLFQMVSRKNTGAGSVREYEELRLPDKASRRQAAYSFFQQIYVWCAKVPLLRIYLMGIRRRLAVLHVVDEWKLRLETIKLALAVWGVLIAAVVPLLWITDDVLMLLLLATGIWVGHGVMADAFVHRLENRQLHQLRHFLTDVRHHYHRHGMVEEAIFDAAETAPHEMALHAREIYEVLTSSNPEERLEQYYEATPNRFLKGLAGISHLIREYGDIMTQHGSVYLKALGQLTGELNLAILRREKLSFLLQGLTAIALIPLLFTKPIENWARSYFPAMDAFYAGKLGWITKIVILLIVLGSYVLLRHMRELDREQQASRRRKPWEQRAYQVPWVQWLVDRIMPGPGTKEYSRGTMLLKETSSPLRLEWFYVQRVAVSILGLLLSIALFVTLHAVTTHQLLNAWDKPDTMFGRLSPEETKAAKDAAALDRKILADVKEAKSRIYEAVLSRLRQEPAFAQNEQQLHAAAQRILRKLEALNREYLKWWEVMLGLLIGWGGYFVPVWMLLFRRRLRQMEMKHEVDQFHAVIAMLSEMDRISVEQLLEWMERFAFIFKEPLQQCLLHYEHGAEQALERLKEEAPFAPFVRIVDRLQLAAESVPIRRAFDDLESEREFMREQRKQDYERLIETKAGWGKMIGFAPMVSLIFLHLVFPLVYVSLSQMSVYYEQIHRIQ